MTRCTLYSTRSGRHFQCTLTDVGVRRKGDGVRLASWMNPHGGAAACARTIIDPVVPCDPPHVLCHDRHGVVARFGEWPGRQPGDLPAMAVVPRAPCHRGGGCAHHKDISATQRQCRLHLDPPGFDDPPQTADPSVQGRGRSAWHLLDSAADGCHGLDTRPRVIHKPLSALQKAASSHEY